VPGWPSSGSAAAVAAGLVPLALGSDTNGSIRVPASLCGVFGLKPTYGRLSRARTFPFAASFDHVGPLARSARDLALAYDVMQGYDLDDPVCADRAAEPVVPLLDRGTEGLRIAVAGGYFKCRTGEACYALDRVALFARGPAPDVVDRHRRGQVAVAEHGALRQSRGAAGILQQRDVIG